MPHRTNDMEFLRIEAVEGIQAVWCSPGPIITCDSLRFGDQLARFTNAIAGHQAIPPGAALSWAKVFYQALCMVSRSRKRSIKRRMRLIQVLFSWLEGTSAFVVQAKDACDVDLRLLRHSLDCRRGDFCVAVISLPILQFPFLLAIGIARVSSTLSVYTVAAHRAQRGFSKIVSVHRGNPRASVS